MQIEWENAQLPRYYKRDWQPDTYWNLFGHIKNISGDGTDVYGKVSSRLSGSITDITGDLSGIRGELRGLLWGDVTGLSCDVTGLYGDASKIERGRRLNIGDYIVAVGKLIVLTGIWWLFA